jgi:hypothetical protein
MLRKDDKLRPNEKGLLFGDILTRFFASSPSGNEKLKQTDARLFVRSLTKRITEMYYSSSFCICWLHDNGGTV